MTLIGEGTQRVIKRPKTRIDEVEFARTRLGFQPDERQAEVLRSKAKRGILNCSRQWGKSTVTAAKALHRVLTTPGSLVLVASPSKRQSGGVDAEGEEDGGADGDQAAGRRGQCGLAAAAERVEDRGIAGGGGYDTRVFGGVAAGDRRGFAGERRDVRGAAADAGGGGRRFVADEHAAREERVLLRDVGARRGRVAAGARCRRRSVAQISKRFLEEQRRVMGADKFRQEHMCEFVGRGMGVFDRELVEALLDDEVEPMEV